MKLANKILWIFVILFLSQAVYSVGVYDDESSGKYIYYTNNPTPEILVNVTPSSDSLFVEKGVFTLDGAEYVKDYNKKIFSGIETFSYIVGQALTPNSDAKFDLLVYDSEGKRVKINNMAQIPTSFRISLDVNTPTLSNINNNEVIYLDTSNTQLEMRFDEKIYKYRIYKNGELLNEVKFNSKLKSSYNNVLVYDFNNLEFGNNNIKVEFFDFAENMGSMEFVINYDYSDCYAGEVKIEHGTSKLLYNSRSVSYSETQTCDSFAEIRTCTDGKLDGNINFKYDSCTMQSPNGCSAPTGDTLNHGETIKLYNNYYATGDISKTCDSIGVSKVFTCSNGNFDSDISSYAYKQCQVIPEGSCVLDDGQEINGNFFIQDMSTYTFYNNEIVYSNNDSALSCSDADSSSSIERSCSSGVLSGDSSYKYASCEVLPVGACIGPDENTYLNGTSKIFYDVEKVAYGDSCAQHKISRKCTDTRWDGDSAYNLLACEETTRDPCLDDFTLSSCPFLSRLVTKKEDSSLKYFYDNRFSDFFNKKISAQSNDFPLKIETNRDAKCYINYYLRSFSDNFNQIKTDQSTVEFASSDGRVHTAEISIPEQGNYNVWVGCERLGGGESTYLSEYLDMGKSLIGFEIFEAEPVKINSVYPTDAGVITNLDFPSIVKTNSDAVCSYKFVSKNDFYSSTNYNLHSKDLNVPQNGKYSLDVSCFDRIYNIDETKVNFDVDTTMGIKVSDYSPKVTIEPSVNVNVRLSEFPSECRYGNSDNIFNYDNYNIISFMPNSLEGNFTVSGLNDGENNKIYIYCVGEGDSIASMDSIDIFYTSARPSIYNVSFVNYAEDKTVYSDYISNSSKLEMSFDVISNISISGYNITIFDDNGNSSSMIRNSNRFTLLQDFTSVTKIGILALGEYGIKSDMYHKNILIDSDSPLLNIVQDKNKFSISCNDFDSGCMDDIYYGFSLTSIDCNPKTKYSDNVTIDSDEYNYICAKGYDKAANVGYDSLSIDKDALVAGAGFLENMSDTNSSNETQDSESDEDPFEGFDVDNTSGTTQDGSDFTYVIVGAIFLVAAAAGGGGYYAYRKGYLNSQLEKLGIKTSNTKSGASTSKVSRPNNIFAKNDTKKTDNKDTVKSTNIPASKKSSYDEHLSKLRNFVDHTLDNRKEVFDSFKDSGKGKTSFDDTLMKKKNSKSQDEFDDFYETSKSKSKIDINKESVDLQKEADDFEEYYKKKKNKK